MTPIVKRIHHVAYRCKDALETARWYEKHLGMKLVLSIAEDAVPSTGEPDPYMHIFMDAGMGNVLAFFELPTQPEMGRDPNSDIDATPLFELPFHAVFPPGHALTARETVRWADLVDHPLITLQGQFTERLTLELGTGRRGPGLKPAHEVSFMATALKMVAAGLGVTVCLPYAAELVEQQGLLLRPLQAPVVRRGVYVFTRRGRTLSPAAEAMLAHIRAEAARQLQVLSERGWL